jgi:hypothetical protein
VKQLLDHPVLLAECIGGMFLGLALIAVGVVIRR